MFFRSVLDELFVNLRHMLHGIYYDFCPFRLIENRFVPENNPGTKLRTENQKEILDLISENQMEFGRFLLDSGSVPDRRGLKKELDFLR